MSLIPLARGDIIVGRPLPWSLHDRDGNLLLRRGYVVESRSQFELLLQKGVYRSRESRLAPVTRQENAAPEKTPGGDPAADRTENLEDIKLHIGDTLQLQSHADEGGTRHYVRLIGYAKGKSVLVTTPVVDGKVCLMHEGQSFVVRAFSGRNAYAFSASIRKVANTPFPHLHLSYPNDVRSALVRKDSRVSTNIIAAVTVHGGRQPSGMIAATIANLSVGGALLAAAKQLGRKGDKLSVKFRVALHDIEVYTTLDAIIRSVGQEVPADGDTAAFNYGIQFVNVPEPHVVALTAFVYHMLIDECAAA